MARAADAGHARAQYTLSMMYNSGEGVQASPRMHAYYLKMSADQGFAKAACAAPRCLVSSRACCVRARVRQTMTSSCGG